jgi:hypothetical protein
MQRRTESQPMSICEKMTPEEVNVGRGFRNGMRNRNAGTIAEIDPDCCEVSDIPAA